MACRRRRAAGGGRVVTCVFSPSHERQAAGRRAGAGKPLGLRPAEGCGFRAFAGSGASTGRTEARCELEDEQSTGSRA